MDHRGSMTLLQPSDLGFPSSLFPFFREGQLEIAVEASSSPHRFYVLNRPVGGGKSLGCQTYHVLRGGRTLTLAPTKNLQLQLEGDFSGMSNIYGHSHYDCASSSVSDGEMDFECSDRENCEYRPRVEDCCKSNNVLTNPAHWVTILKSDNPDRLGKFDNLVIDECHRIHDMLCDYISFTLSPRRILRLLHLELTLTSQSSLAEWHEWALFARRKCQSEIDKLKSNNKGWDEKQVRRLNFLRAELSRFADTYPSTEWVVADIPYSDGQIKITPVWAERFTEEYLFSGIPNIFMCSGTIQEASLASLGILPGSYTYRDEESLFPAHLSPFIYIPTIAVNARMSDGDKGVLIRRIDQIIGESLAYKGTIQATGYEWARTIYYASKYGKRWRDYEMANFTGEQIILPGIDKDSARQAFEYFDSDLSHPPDVLLSPVIKEGLDLHGNKCRYQIIPKIPFPDLRDPLTAARARTNKGYMTQIAALSLEQMKGRSTRSRTDWSVTYMLDDGWNAPWFRKVAPFSTSFRRGVKTMEGVRGIAEMYKEIEGYVAAARG
jgi:ATP-dependent DNA helicase DinG